MWVMPKAVVFCCHLTGEYRVCPLSPLPVSYRHLDLNQACLELLGDKASLRKARYSLLDTPCITLPDLK